MISCQVHRTYRCDRLVHTHEAGPSQRCRRHSADTVGVHPGVGCARDEELMTVRLTAVVTGANSGIGLGTVRGLAEGTGAIVNCLDPGNVATKIVNPPAPIRLLGRMIFLDAARGAETTLAAATNAEYGDVNGSYFVKSKPADHKLSAAARDGEVAAGLWVATEAALVSSPPRSHEGPP